MSLSIVASKDCSLWGQSIAAALGSTCEEIEISYFPSGEFSVRESPSLKADIGIFIYSLFPHPQEQLAQLFLMLTHLKQRIKKLIVVIPFFPYSRQKTGAFLKVIGKIFDNLGVDSLVTIEPHTVDFVSFFHCPTYILRPQLPKLMELFPTISPLSTIVMSPDQGGEERVQHWAAQWDLPWGFCIKERIGSLCTVRDLKGDIQGKSVILIDDIIDTGSTLCQAAAFLKNKGAHNVYAIGIHPILSQGALSRLKESALSQLVVCDTIPSPLVRSISLTPQITDYVASLIS